MKTIFIVILNFNTKDSTLKCLNSLKKINLNNFRVRVVVVDNGSKENFDLKEENFKELSLKIIKNKENLGFSGGNNVGIDYALKNGADYVMLLNSDTIVGEDLVLELIGGFKGDDKIGITAPKIYFAKGFEFHRDRYKKEDLGKVIWYAGGKTDWKNVISYHRGVDEVDNRQYDKIEETNFATGCCLLIKREILKKVGFLDNKFFLYYEDGDFSQRVKRAGYKILYVPKAMLWHENAGSGGGSGSPLQDYYITRNRMLFGIRFAPLRSKIALVRESFKLLINGRPWQKKGIKDFYIGKFGKGSYKS